MDVPVGDSIFPFLPEPQVDLRGTTTVGTVRVEIT
jgi:hypothetical protein